MLTVSLFPSVISAEIGDGYGQCEHHASHNAQCGFYETGTCTYVCETCLEKTEDLVSALPSMNELKEMTAEQKSEVQNQLDAIDRQKLNLSDAGREHIDWTKYDEACFVIFMPEGYFGASIRKGYLTDSDYKPKPQFAFVNEQGNRTPVLYSDLNSQSELLSLDESLYSGYFYLPAGTYTVEEIVDGNWTLSLTVDGVPSPDLTFTGTEGSIRTLKGDNGSDGVTWLITTANGNTKPMTSNTYTYNEVLNEAFSNSSLFSSCTIEACVDFDYDVTINSAHCDFEGGSHSMTGKWTINTDGIKLLSGTFSEITVADNMTLASILKEGYCFKSGDTIVDSTLKTVSGEVKVIKIPITSVTVKDLPSVIYYGDTVPLEITDVSVIEGADKTGITYKWYEGENVLGTASKYDYNTSDDLEHTVKCDITLNGYTTTKSFTFKPEKKDFKKAVITLSSFQTYTGEELTQTIDKIEFNGLTLRENTDYTVSGNKQTNVKTDGDYTLTVTGIGSFAGEQTLDWNILPAVPSEGVKTTARVRKNKALENASVAYGKILGLDGTTPLEGTFEWTDKDKIITADCTEEMTFTPSDTNYKPITINVEVDAYSSSSSGGGSSSYTIKFNSNGGSSVSSQTVVRGKTASEPAVPTKDGYIFDGWYTDSGLASKYDFDTAVTKTVTLYAKWLEDELQEPDGEPDVMPDDEPESLQFTDVAENDWFFGYVKYVSENGLMYGMGENTFEPDGLITRGMFAAALYRLEGEPAIENKAMPFSDVKSDSYYAEAVSWAEQNGIVLGASETEFAPDEYITREQIAAIIYRYADFKGIAPTGAWAIRLDYADVNEISDYAVEGVMYCTLKSIMQGRDKNCFAPKDNASRAEIAAILQRIAEANK